MSLEKGKFRFSFSKEKAQLKKMYTPIIFNTLPLLSDDPWTELVDLFLLLDMLISIVFCLAFLGTMISPLPCNILILVLTGFPSLAIEIFLLDLPEYKYLDKYVMLRLAAFVLVGIRSCCCWWFPLSRQIKKEMTVEDYDSEKKQRSEMEVAKSAVI